MPNETEAADRGIRRRLVTMGLGIRPLDVRQTLEIHPVKVSAILSGRQPLRPDEGRKLARLVRARMKALFEEHDE